VGGGGNGFWYGVHKAQFGSVCLGPVFSDIQYSHTMQIADLKMVRGAAWCVHFPSCRKLLQLILTGMCVSPFQ
jgi:hypothetical protein